MMAWLCDMRSTWLWWPKCNQVWAWLESGLAYPSIARMSMAKRSFHSMAQYLGFVKAPEKDGRDYSVVFEVGFKIKWFISSSPDCKKKTDAGFVGHKGGQTPEVGGLTGMPFLPATWLKRLNLYTGTNNGNRYYFENSHPLQNLGHIVMFHGTADDFPSNILWTNWILERQGWILWENARLLKDDTRPCHFGCYAWWRFSWGQGSYNTSGECWEVEGPSLWDSVRSVRVSGVAVNESHKFTLGPALAASTFRRMPLKEESNLWRKLSSFRLCLKARSFYLDFQSNMPV